MHFTAPLIALSGAAVALAGSFPAAPVAAGHNHLALRQATRDQILRRQAHPQRMRRQNGPSALPTACGLPSSFTVQFNGLTGDFAQYNGQYGTLFETGDDFGTQLLSAGTFEQAQTFANDNTAGTCALTGNALLANIGGTGAQPVYFNTQADTEGYALPSCRGGSNGDISCSASADGTTINNVLVVCPVPSTDGTEFPVLYLYDAATAVDNGCQLVTITYELAA